MQKQCARTEGIEEASGGNEPCPVEGGSLDQAEEGSRPAVVSRPAPTARQTVRATRQPVAAQSPVPTGTEAHRITVSLSAIIPIASQDCHNIRKKTFFAVKTIFREYFANLVKL